jgi:hypothetical protein
MRATLAALVALVLLPGCTPSVLRQHSVSLSGATSDLRYREVIENLAMVYANPSAVPAYSSVYSAGMDVTDTAQIDGTTTWVHAVKPPSGFSAQTMDIPITRTVKGTLTLDPTIVPEKLRAMRAICQWALFGEANVYPDHALLCTYRANPSSDGRPRPYFGVDTELSDLSRFEWLGRGHSRHDVPKNACYWAGSSGAYVWVCPEDMESFSRFVLVFQKIARFDLSTLYKPSIDTRSVQWTVTPSTPYNVTQITVYVDPNGRLALTQNSPALPPKTRNDNVGQETDLKAAINSAVKSQ